MVSKDGKSEELKADKVLQAIGFGPNAETIAGAETHALGDPSGFVKLIADKKHLELLGGHLIGPDVAELLPELTLAHKWALTAQELARNVHTHPTLSEALQECFHGLVGHMINF
jgi:dihydrolipoamide dehydrogenase